MKALYVRSLRMRLPLLGLALGSTLLLRLAAQLAFSRGEDGLRAISGLTLAMLLPLLGLSLGGSLFDAEELPATFLWARPLARRAIVRARLCADLTVLGLAWATAAGTLGLWLDGDWSALVSLGGTGSALVLYLLGGLASMAGLSATAAAAAATAGGAGLALLVLAGRAIGAPLAHRLVPSTLGEVLLYETLEQALLVVILCVVAGCAVALAVQGRMLPRRVSAKVAAVPLGAALVIGLVSPIAHAGYIRALAPRAGAGVGVRLHAPASPGAPPHSYWIGPAAGVRGHGFSHLRTIWRIDSAVAELPDVSPGGYTACATARHVGTGFDEYVVCRDITVKEAPGVQDFALEQGPAQPAQNPAPQAQ